jgi:hypothetical protein
MPVVQCTILDGPSRSAAVFAHCFTGSVIKLRRTDSGMTIIPARVVALRCRWPGRAVTFVDNHDTGSTQNHWPFVPDRVGAGYAYILTHPGIPCIFWDHYFTWGAEMRNTIHTLAAVSDWKYMRSLSIRCHRLAYSNAKYKGVQCSMLGMLRMMDDGAKTFLSCVVYAFCRFVAATTSCLTAASRSWQRSQTCMWPRLVALSSSSWAQGEVETAVSNQAININICSSERFTERSMPALH